MSYDVMLQLHLTQHKLALGPGGNIDQPTKNAANDNFARVFDLQKTPREF